MADIEFLGDESSLAVVRRRKHFTLQHANRTLPLVRRIVADVVATHARASELHNKLDYSMPRDRREQLEAELEVVVQRLDNLVDELTEIGCEIKDYRLGLVDFATRHNGRDIYLCWRLGEDRITRWHEIDVDFSAAKPLSLL